MEFSGQYLTYDEFSILGGTLEIMPFNLLELKARKEIDARTQGRLNGIEEIPQEVKLCVYELIRVLKGYDGYISQSKGISSESTDGYSVSYGGANKSLTVAKESEINDVIENYLYDVCVNNVPVLYLGVC